MEFIPFHNEKRMFNLSYGHIPVACNHRFISVTILRMGICVIF